MNNIHIVLIYIVLIHIVLNLFKLLEIIVFHKNKKILFINLLVTSENLSLHLDCHLLSVVCSFVRFVLY